MRTDMDYRNMKAAAAKKANAKYKAKLDEARQVLKDIKEYENNFSDSD